MKSTLHNTTATTNNASVHKPFFQPKLSINQPNDVYEQEADAIADKVMRMPDKYGQKQTFFKPAISTVQRKCKECEEEEKIQRKQNLEDDDSLLQRKALNPAFIQKKCAACEEDRQMQRKESKATSVGATNTVYQVLQTKGHSLDSRTKSFMESRFGYDFKDVQVHNDLLAHQSSAEINALAYTQGKHVVFGANQYQPNTDGGKRLLAHELTHVVQQGASSSLNNQLNRKPDEDEEPPLTRYQEIEQSIDSPGEFEVLEQPFGISIYNFAINRYALKAEHKSALKKIGNMLASAKDNSLSVLIMGNTDSTGGPIINNPLSVNRAKNVRNYLTDVTGRKYPVEGEGQYMPVATNEIVSGRTRNRRVDIVITHPSIQTKPNSTGLILPPPYVYKAPVKIYRDELINKEKKRPEDCPWPWSCIDIPWIWPWFPIPHCVKLFIECDGGENPEACYEFYEDCIKSDEKKKRACPEKVDLPEGDLQVDMMWPYMALRNPFWMKINFKDDKNNGCYCECGEYKQNVRGFFEIEYKDGKIERIRKGLTPGVELEENTFHEDGDGRADSEYGHRSHPGRLTNNSKTFFVDKFFPDQKDGCSYIGMDQPGIGNGLAQPDEVRRTWFLEFEGMPVDSCMLTGIRVPLVQYKKIWRIQGEIIRPPEPKPKVPVKPITPPVPKAPGNGGSGSGGNSKLVPVTPTKAKTHPSHSMPSSIEGISPNAKVGQEFDMTILFNIPGKSETYSSTVHVTVVEPTNKDFITIVTSNRDALNLAPQGESEIVLKAHKRIKLERSDLQ